MRTIAWIAEAGALSFSLGKGSARPLSNQPAFFLGKRGVEMQHEGIGVCAEFRDYERHAAPSAPR